MVSRCVSDMDDLIWVDFDPTKGSEQAGHRPAVVLSLSMYNSKTGMCLCIPCTIQSEGYPFEVVLSDQERDGVALVDQIKSIAWRARGAIKKRTVALEELQPIKVKINVLIGQRYQLTSILVTSFHLTDPQFSGQLNESN